MGIQAVTENVQAYESRHAEGRQNGGFEDIMRGYEGSGRNAYEAKNDAAMKSSSAVDNDPTAAVPLNEKLYNAKAGDEKIMASSIDGEPIELTDVVSDEEAPLASKGEGEAENGQDIATSFFYLNDGFAKLFGIDANAVEGSAGGINGAAMKGYFDSFETKTFHEEITALNEKASGTDGAVSILAEDEPIELTDVYVEDENAGKTEELHLGEKADNTVDNELNIMSSAPGERDGGQSFEDRGNRDSAQAMNAANAASVKNAGADNSFDAALDANKAVTSRWEVFETLGNAVRLSLGKGGREVKLNLNPESLGKIQIKLNIDKDTVKADITVGSAEVKEALQADTEKLKGIFSGQGLTLEEYSIGIDSSFVTDKDAGAAGPPRVSAFSGAEGVSEENSNAEKTVSATIRVSNGIDIFI